jgi:hypothetical protein
MKKLIYVPCILISIICLVFFVHGCSSDRDYEQNETENLDEKFFSDKDVLYLTDINREILAKMKDADQDKLEKAILANNDEEIGNLLGYTSTEMQIILKSIESSANNIINSYPEVVEEINKRKQNKCLECDFEITNSFEILKNNDFNDFSIKHQTPLLKNGSESGDCRDGTSFTFCCIACAAAPVTVWAYPACAMACYLAFCK